MNSQSLTESAQQVLPRAVRISLRRKLMLLVLATTFIALLLMGGTMLVFDLRTYRDAWVGDLFAQADLIGRASAPALAFDDEKVARENLSLLKDRPKVMAAAIYTGSGELFASFTQVGSQELRFPDRPEPEGYRVRGGELELYKPITVNNERVGTVYFRTQYELMERLLTYLAILAAVTAASLAAAVAATAWLQKSLAAPILAMTDAARQVMDRRDYTLRVRRASDDEVGFLVDTFNAMLSEIGRRSEQLEMSNRSLEQEMAVRGQAEEALRAADRQKDRFLATLAHELRNPLAPLLNALELLRRPGLEGQASSRATRDMMERQLRQLVQLVNDLLDVSRITTGKLVLQKKEERLGDLVQAALEATSPLIAQRRHRLALTLPGEPIHLLADGTRVVQVLVNLLNNAAKFTDEGGHIGLEVRRQGDCAWLIVSDDGIGISPAMLPHVFDMFAQADDSLQRPHAGLGVGLALARQLVDLHGGSVEARSAGQGMGSVFSVSLPVLPHTAPEVPEAASAAPPDRGALRILIVDDNVDYAASMAQLLEMDGHEVAVAHDGLLALELAQRTLPQLCLLDIGLPGLDGYDLARALRAAPGTRDAMLVAISGWGQPEDKRLAREAGFDLHLAKPVDFAQVQAIVTQRVQALSG